MRKVRWIAQNNLISEIDRDRMKQACDNLGVMYEGVHVLPFAYGLPKFTEDDSINVYYGSTTFISNLMQTDLDKTGIFLDESKFLMSNYLSQWGEHMLSSEARVLKFKEFIAEDHEPKSSWFIRPNADSKSFDGNVKDFGEIENWFNNVQQMFDNVELDENTDILVGPAYNIRKEWRNFVVDGKVVSSSLYRENFRLKKSADDIPAEMIEFVEARAKEYSPNEVFVMDIALCGGDHEYYIIECGCMNSVGFYHSDIQQIVKSVTDHVSLKD